MIQRVLVLKCLHQSYRPPSEPSRTLSEREPSLPSASLTLAHARPVCGAARISARKVSHTQLRPSDLYFQYCPYQNLPCHDLHLLLVPSPPRKGQARSDLQCRALTCLVAFARRDYPNRVG